MDNKKLTQIICNAGFNHYGEMWTKKVNKTELLDLYNFLLSNKATVTQSARAVNWYFEDLNYGRVHNS